MELNLRDIGKNRRYPVFVTVSLAAFFAVTMSMFSKSVRDFNGQIVIAIIEARTQFQTAILGPISSLGSPGGLMILTILAVLVLALLKEWDNLCFLFTTMMSVPLLVIAIKSILSQHPPSSVDAAIELNNMLTYPSDQTLAAAALLTSALIIFVGRIKTRSARLATSSVSILAVALVAYSKLYYGRHYPTDVLAGVLLGFSWSIFCKIIFDKLAARRSFKRLRSIK